MAAGTHRASLCSYVVVDFRLRLARYVAIACLGFPLLFRRSGSDVGLGWVGCCAAFSVVYYLTSLAVLRIVRYDNDLKVRVAKWCDV